MNARDPVGRGRGRVLLASPRELLASSLRSVLEPHGYVVVDVQSVEALEEALRVSPPDLIILDEDLADDARAVVRTDSEAPALLPILLYSAGHWRGAGDARARAVGAWDVVEEPIRTQDLLSRLGRLLHLKKMWDAVPAAGDERSGAHVSRLLRIAPTLGSIASRAGEPLGCAVLGPTRRATDDSDTNARDRDAMALVSGQLRGSDVCVWVGPAELAVVLYGAGIDGLGQFVGRVARGAGEGERGRSLSAGLVEIEPRAFGGGPADRGSGEGETSGFWILGHVEAAIGALERARDAGGGVRVAVSS